MEIDRELRARSHGGAPFPPACPVAPAMGPGDDSLRMSAAHRSTGPGHHEIVLHVIDPAGSP
jgi:hypothetical protein